MGSLGIPCRNRHYRGCAGDDPALRASRKIARGNGRNNGSRSDVLWSICFQSRAQRVGQNARNLRGSELDISRERPRSWAPRDRQGGLKPASPSTATPSGSPAARCHAHRAGFASTRPGCRLAAWKTARTINQLTRDFAHQPPRLFSSFWAVLSVGSIDRALRKSAMASALRPKALLESPRLS